MTHTNQFKSDQIDQMKSLEKVYFGTVENFELFL